MSENSPLLDLPLIQPAQAQKHVTHNEALERLDVLALRFVAAGHVVHADDRGTKSPHRGLECVGRAVEQVLLPDLRADHFEHLVEWGAL